MKLSAVKAALAGLEKVDFQFEDGTFVPEHFHVTEVGHVEKKYIDCGGVIREEKYVSFQLWNANDTEHRLKAGKLLNIIRLSERKLAIEDAEVEVEFQGEHTIGKYYLRFTGTHFVLVNTLTACLAEDACGIKPEHLPQPTASEGGCCSSDSQCC
ncbi:DUF6428 family protein [Myroides pelagicus]|uniref:Uncharacterized protein n=1 Tax=Myroides pelagicus TaxID=270914 RepID=A0A7K1GPR2_9FLAO|nr:DUF6428 family protein [Myroides pelagicus]MEC4114657.1 DUF6428 family protein [Myroides pelagicus]MTH30841.1 hypothetical protein [Myroides pelagicus]